MRKLKIQISLLALVLAMLSGIPALAQLSFQGTVISNDKQTVNAPFGGILRRVEALKGDPIHIGDPVATIDTTKVFATVDGTVSGIFAEPGDQCDGVSERYGGVMFIEPVHKYVVSATTEKAYNSSETRYIHIGEKVYLSCTKDGTHVGTAVVTNVGGSSGGSSSDDSGSSSSGSSSGGSTAYTLEVISGEFYMGETVGIYRDSAYSNYSRIGRGTVSQNTAVAIKGSGSVLKLHAQVGDRVERGELLFETVEGALEGLYAVDNTIVSPIDGIVAEVKAEQGTNIEKNAALISVYPRDSLQIEIKVSELDLNELHEGDKVTIEYGWDLDGTQQLDGIVSRISYVVEGEQTEKSTDAQYSAYVSFTPDDSVRLGMTASVYTLDAPLELPEDGEAADAETAENEN